ncbi:MAG: hypothetical protein ACPG7F_19510 [Aggregatilineales bacterium]
MADYRERTSSKGRTFLSLVLISAGIFVCSVTTVFAMDINCYNDINHWMPVYPDATLLEDETVHDFFRPRAMGRTQMYFVTEDTSNTVRSWYRDYRREITRGVQGISSETAARGVATVYQEVSENPDGNGSLIYQSSECAFG